MVTAIIVIRKEQPDSATAKSWVQNVEAALQQYPDITVNSKIVEDVDGG